MTIINKKTPIKNMNDIKGNLTQKIRSWKRFKLSVLFTAVAVLSAALVFYAPFCYAGGVNNSGTQNKNKSAEKVKSRGIFFFDGSSKSKPANSLLNFLSCFSTSG